MKRFLRTVLAIACLLTLSTPAFAQKKAGATEKEYGNIVVYLETAEWGQNAPYNQLCLTSSGAQAKTGCVPTAYGILMHYHKWPANAYEKKVYHSGTGESITLGHEYDWENMLNNYSASYNETEATAVATLMRDLGWAYGVEYGTGSTQSGSGGEGAAKLVDVFKYRSETPNSQSAQFGTVRDIVANDKLWIEYIKQSLDAGCPIPYSSTTTSGGRHIFILDGYTDNGYFHFNWGWGGQGNGWFKLDNMKPDTYSDYSKSHRAYFMLKPDKKAHTISVSVNDSSAGTATVNGESSITLNEGETATLVATPNEGYMFKNWTLNGTETSREAIYRITATAPADYIANFEEITAVTEVTIKAESTTGGTATVNGTAETTVAIGTAITLTATPDDGYRFVEWRAGTEVVARTPSFTTSAQSDRTYTALFEEAATETVTITLKGSGGYYYVGNSTARVLEVEKGSSVSIRAQAAEGSGKKFAYWSTGNTIASGKGTIHTNKNPYEFIANKDITFYVNFVSGDVDLNVTVAAEATAGGEATINGGKSQDIALGSDITFVATAHNGYYFTAWTDSNGNIVSTEPVYTSVVREAMILTANFEGATEIKEIGAEVKKDLIYDITGRPLERISSPGIYIINGKKVLVK